MDQPATPPSQQAGEPAKPAEGAKPLTMEQVKAKGAEMLKAAFAEEAKSQPPAPEEGVETKPETPPEEGESKAEQGTDKGGEEAVDTFFEKGPNGEMKEIKAQDLVKQLEFPIKRRGKWLSLPYDKLIQMAQIGYDSDQIRKESQAVKNQLEGVQTRFSEALQEREAEIRQEIYAEIEALRGSTGDEELPQKLARKREEDRLARIEQENLRIRKEMEDTKRSGVIRERQGTMAEIDHQTLEPYKARFKEAGKEGLIRTFENAVKNDLKERVIDAFRENGEREISYEQYEEILKDTVKEHFQGFSDIVVPKAKPKTPPTPHAQPGGAKVPSSAPKGPWKLAEVKSRGADFLKSLQSRG